jgi:hypothetical protein
MTTRAVVGVQGSAYLVVLDAEASPLEAVAVVVDRQTPSAFNYVAPASRKSRYS